jgi:hypothetical protein
MASREDGAAAKIQALQRGRHARKEVEDKKNRESAAATRIQAIQRGRHSRKVAAQVRKDLELFVRPATKQTQQYVDVRMSLPALRQRVKNWEEFVESVSGADFVDGAHTIDFDHIMYSTEAQPDSFPNAFSRKLFDSIVAYDAARVDAQQKRAKHEAIEAAKPPPPPAAVRTDGAEDDEEESATPTKSKKQLREEAEQRKADRERLKGVLDAEHDAACRQQKLANVVKLHSLRFPIARNSA